MSLLPSAYFFRVACIHTGCFRQGGKSAQRTLEQSSLSLSVPCHLLEWILQLLLSPHHTRSI